MFRSQGWLVTQDLFLTARMLAAALLAAGTAVAADAPAQPLAADSAWRHWMYWTTQQARLASGAVQYGHFDERRKWNEDAQVSRSATPPAGWQAPAFDDHAWSCDRGPFGPLRTRGGEHEAATLAGIFLRGQFEVADPAAPAHLVLTFSGGAVVYVNGTEAGRAGLPAGALTPDTPAEAYPDEVWLAPDGKLLTRSFDETKYADAFRKRLRTLEIAIPAALLRKGPNLLAVEIHRAPVNEVQFQARSKGETSYAEWYAIGLNTLALEGAGLAASSRPEGARVSNAGTLTKVRLPDPGEDGSALRPVAIVGARNGKFSGQVVVSSAQSLAGLSAQASALTGEAGAVIPASALQVRYALPDGPDNAGFFDGLLEAPPAEAPRGKLGAVQPVWVTVQVPADARPGKYSGKLSLRGPLQADVPIQLSVAGWTLPDSRQFATFLDLVQSPETQAEAYHVPLWSDRHWLAVDRSFQLMGEVGCKAIYISLVRRTDFGNQHGMVRWVRKGDGWEPDLRIAERYIETAVRHLGKVPVVVLNIWHSETGGQYMGGSDMVNVGNVGFPYTEVNPATGELTEANGPTWSDPRIVDLLKPAVDGLREILRKHGIEKSMMVGIATDMRPKPDALEAIRKIAPDLKWAVACHPFTDKIGTTEVGYLAHVWGITPTRNPYRPVTEGEPRTCGWQNPNLYTAFPRYGCSIVGNQLHLNTPLSAYRGVMEAAITSPGKILTAQGGGSKLYALGLRGVGRLGADFWHVVPGPNGSFAAFHTRYPKKGDHAVNLQFSAYYLLSRGPEGALSSARFEALREGIEEAEARVFLEKTLAAGKLEAALAKSCRDILDERAMALVWARDGSMWSETGWQWYRAGCADRAARLYQAAADAAAATSGR
jgi:hypothetical protein